MIEENNYIIFSKGSVMTNKTNTAQLEAVKRYKKKTVRHEFMYSLETDEGKLLKLAKEKGDLNKNFKIFLKEKYG